MSEAITCRLAGTKNIVVASSSAAISLATTMGTQVRIMNDGTATVWVEFGPSSVTAAVATGIPIPAAGVEVLTAPNFGGQTVYVAAIAAAATGSIYFTPCGGI